MSGYRLPLLLDQLAHRRQRQPGLSENSDQNSIFLHFLGIQERQNVAANHGCSVLGSVAHFAKLA